MAEPIEIPFGGDSGRSKEPCIRWESRSSKGKGQFLGLSGPFKSMESRCISHPVSK